MTKIIHKFYTWSQGDCGLPKMFVGALLLFSSLAFMIFFSLWSVIMTFIKAHELTDSLSLSFLAFVIAFAFIYSVWHVIVNAVDKAILIYNHPNHSRRGSMDTL